MQHVIVINKRLSNLRRVSDEIGAYWTDHRKLFSFLGLLRNGQDHNDMGGSTWTDKIFDHPGLRASQLVNVHNGFDAGCSISDSDWYDEVEWPFSMDAEINPAEISYALSIAIDDTTPGALIFYNSITISFIFGTLITIVVSASCTYVTNPMWTTTSRKTRVKAA